MAGSKDPAVFIFGRRPVPSNCPMHWEAISMHIIAGSAIGRYRFQGKAVIDDGGRPTTTHEAGA
jgi:hypothetical protein